ncbi:MAG: carotenoid biosynthesis protein [Bacteroidetes bacterium]|nr:MAG: carotenoid biosynthesis protein [Bacteroidota bacterium]
MKGKVNISDSLLTTVLLILYAVGVAGLQFSETKSLFLAMVPGFLLVNLIILLFKHESFTKSFGLWALITYVIGFSAEWVGVHTGLIFGRYVYGPVLGWQLDEIPLIIGVNWVLLAYASRDIAGRVFKHPVLRILFAAVLMVLLDLQIEPVAQELNFWIWADFQIPLQNYIGWFGVSVLLFSLSEWLFKRWYNPLSVQVYLGLYVFFTLLRLMQ